MARQRRTNSIPALASEGRLQEGTIIEVRPEYRPGHPNSPVFRAQILNQYGGPGALIWQHDQQAYGITELTNLLKTYGLHWPARRAVSELWQIEGHTRSLFEEATPFA